MAILRYFAFSMFVAGAAEAQSGLVAYLPVFDGTDPENVVVRDLQVWSLDGPFLRSTIRLGEGIAAIDVSRSGARVYVGSASDRSLAVINAATLEIDRVFQLPDRIVGLSIPADETVVYWAGRDNLNRLDLESGANSVLQAPGRIQEMWVSTDRTVLLLRGHDELGFDYEMGVVVPENEVRFRFDALDDVPSGSAMGISGDRSILYSARGSTIYAIDIPTGEILWIREVVFGPIAVSVTELLTSNDDSKLYVSSVQGLHVMDINSGQLDFLGEPLIVREIDRLGTYVISLPFPTLSNCPSPPVPLCQPNYGDTEAVVIDLSNGSIQARIPFVHGAAAGIGSFLGPAPPIGVNSLEGGWLYLMVTLLVIGAAASGRTRERSR